VSRHRLTVSSLIGVTGIVLAMAWQPSVASTLPPGTAISIVSAGADNSGDPYDLTVVADDGNGLPIATMTAHVYSASDQDMADVQMTAVDLTDTSNQIWQAATPIEESALPAGVYTVTVDATDADEMDTAVPAPGTLSVAYTSSSLSVVANPPSVTLGSTTVTFNGTLTGTAPGGTPIGIANVPVDLSINGVPTGQVATTAADGTFSDPISGITQNGAYDFSVAATGSYPAADSGSVSVTAEAAPTAMMVSADPTTVTAGSQNVTFTGTATATPTNAPALGIGSAVPVYLSVGDGPASEVTTTYDSGGDFSYQASGITAGTTYTFSVAGTSLYSSASATPISIGTQAAPAMMALKAAPSDVTFDSQSVTFNGTVTADPEGGGTVGIGSGIPVYLSVGDEPASEVTTTDDTNGDFTYTSGNTEPGSYTFSVAATNLYSAASNEMPVGADAGTTTLTVIANPPDINLGSSSVTFSGAVTVTPAGSTDPVSIGAGVPIDLSGASSNPVAVTNSKGDFRYTVTGIRQPADYDFSLPSSTLYTAATSDVPIGLDQEHSTLTITPSPASVTEGSQTVTFAGTLTGVAPGSTTTVDIQNAPLDLSIGGATAKQVATTDSNGDFTYSVKSISKATAYTFSIGNTTTYTAATDEVPIGVSPARTRIADIKITPAHLKYGQKATLKAVVEYLSGTTWTALRDTEVHLAEGKTSLGTATAGSSGSFTATLPTTHGTGWSAVVSAATMTQQGSAIGNLNIAVPMVVKSFTASLGTNGEVSVRGCLEVTAPVSYGPRTAINVQYADGPRGRWRSLGDLDLHNLAHKYRSCPDANESYFSGAIRARLPNAYYRANFAATDSFQAAVSRVIHAWRIQTRIVYFNVSPRAVANGTPVTITGRLEVHGKSWTGWGGQQVEFSYNQKGTSFWGSLDTSRTNSRGYFTKRAAGGTGEFVAVIYAIYAGAATHLATQSVGIDVSINGGSTGAKAARLDIGQLPALDVPDLPVLEPVVPSFTALVRG
jgi:hypothetical protein